jgi:surface antigen
MFLAIPLLAGCGGSSAWNADSAPPLFEQLSEDDLRLADRTLQEALTVAVSDTTFGWRNTANGHSGTVTPKSSFRTSEGRYCRVYVETVTIERKSELYDNTACMDDAGVWKSVR